MNRLEQTFASLARRKCKALITYVMGGDPDIETSARILQSLPQAGADIVEIGMPFSDPMADGPVIQAAASRALAGGTKLKDILALVRDFRAENGVTPVILMGYYNLLYHYGVEKFCRDAAAAGTDGVILVDLPPEEEEEFTSVATLQGIELIRLVTPTTDDARLALLTRCAGGFLYYVSITGITGTRSAEAGKLDERIRHLKSKTMLPIAVGFGIKTPEQAAQAARFSDGVVVGSALVEILTKDPGKGLEYVTSLRAALDS